MNKRNHTLTKEKTMEEPKAKVEWNADRDCYHITVRGQPTIVAWISELEALGEEIKRALAEGEE